jgi:hypothetical protein
VGESVRRADGSTAMVVSVRSVPGAANMWDLTVANVHTFAVGNGAFVAHNCGLDGNERGIPGDPANQVPGHKNLYYGQAADSDALMQDG